MSFFDRLKSCARLLIVSAFLLVPHTTHAEMPRPMPAGTTTYYYGNVERGDQFGVTVGESRQRAREIMERRGADFIGTFGCDRALSDLIDCHDGQQSDVYDFNGFLRHGKIDLLFSGDRVIAIVWEFYAAPYVDF